MEDLLYTLTYFPPEKQSTPQEFERQAVAYVKKVTNLPAATWSANSEKETLLKSLDPGTNSIPYLLCLVNRLEADGVNETQVVELLPSIVAFFEQFDPVQVRYVGMQWRQLFVLTADAYRALDISDFTPLGDALLRLDPASSTFTINHLVYVRLCLQAGCPSKALQILDRDIHYIPAVASRYLSDELLSEVHEFSSTYITHKTDLAGQVSPEIVLEYYLLGAQVYIGLRRWSRARLFLEYIILHPSPHGAASNFQVEAYRKWILVGLLAQGRTYTYPRTSSPQITKSINAVARPYDALAETFERRNWRKYQAEVDVGATLWTNDGNLRLVNETASTLMKYCVSDLQKTYAALPVSQVASHLGLPSDQTFALVDHLIKQDRLSARIESKQKATPASATVRFETTTSTSITDDVDVEARTKRIDELIRHIREANRRLQLTTEYVEVRRRSKKYGLEGDPADQMDLEWAGTDAPINMADDDGDEDIMA